jgi:glycerol kinase
VTVILGIDQSTSATKALLFTPAGELLDKTSLPHRQIYPRPGWVEHDAEQIYANTLQAIGQLLDKHPDLLQDLLCLSLTNQRETFVIFERASGKPLHNAIVWQCRRGEPVCAELVAAGHSEQVQQLTGLKIDTYFPAPKLKWLLDDQPALRQKLITGEALFGTIDTYLIYRLTGGRVFATDHTNASRTLLYDIRKLRWDEGLCELFGAPPAALPEVRESSARFGVTDLEGRLGRPLPICGVMGDSQAALFAQRAFKAGSAKVTFGTGSSILLNLGDELKYSANGIVTTIGWVYQGRPTYAFEGITNFTGAIIAWLRDQLNLIDSADETEALATAVENNGGVYLVPAFVGFSAPYWRPEARAAILGLTPYSTKNHVVRAALESIAYLIYDVLKLMGQEAGLELQNVRADGGAVKNRFLMQFVADITRLTVRVSSLPELSALGAVFCGALGMREEYDAQYHSLQELQALPMAYLDYRPAMPIEQAQALYQGWQNAIRQILS